MDRHTEGKSIIHHTKTSQAPTSHKHETPLSNILVGNVKYDIAILETKPILKSVTREVHFETNMPIYRLIHIRFDLDCFSWDFQICVTACSRTHGAYGLQSLARICIWYVCKGLILIPPMLLYKLTLAWALKSSRTNTKKRHESFLEMYFNVHPQSLKNIHNSFIRPLS